MKGIINLFSKKLGFTQQMIAVFTVGIMCLAIVSSFTIASVSNRSLYDQILTQSLNVSQSFTRQSILALLYDSEDNAQDASDAIKGFDDLLGVEIFRADKTLLFQQGDFKVPLDLNGKWPETTTLVQEDSNHWYIFAPVIAQEVSLDIEEGDDSEDGNGADSILGYTRIIVSKAGFHALSEQLLKSNLWVSTGLSLLLLLVLLALTKNITRPLKQLIKVMGNTDEDGITKERVALSGPKDITTIEIAFNRMMDELEVREQALTKARDSALGAAHAKGEFAANVSHELRTPMNGVMGMIELLLDTGLDDKQVEYLTVAKNSGNALLTLIDDILDFSKIESGKMRINLTHFSLSDLLHDIKELLSMQVKRKKLQLNYEVDAGIPKAIIADPGRVQQIIINLVGNGIKFTEEGGVTIKACVLNDEQDNQFVKISIIDTGIGIPENAQNKIFEAFTQADSSTTRKFGGTGLGLTICRQLVELMGGTIGLNSEENIGSEFWFTFPMEKALPQEQPDKEASPLKQLKMLIVGESNKYTDAVIACLESEVDNIRSAQKAKTAIVANNAALAGHAPFDCILIIQPLVDMNIYKFCHLLLESEPVAETKVIVCAKPDFDISSLQKMEVTCIEHGLLGQELSTNIIDIVMGKQTQVEAEVAAETPTKVQHKGNEHTVLIVEDNRANQLVALGMMERLGYTAEVADNGRIALEMAARKKYDLILMDCNMPEVDGFKASRMIRDGNSCNARVPIIALTALAGVDSRRQCLEAGMDDYMVKPIELPELESKMEFWLELNTNLVDDINKDNISTTLCEVDLADQEIKSGLQEPFNQEGLDVIKANIGVAFNKVVETAFEDLPKYLLQLKKAIEIKDSKNMLLFAHKIKGTALSLCADPLAKACSEFESLEKHFDYQTIKTIYDKIEYECHRLKEAIKSQTVPESREESITIQQTILVVDDDPSARFALQGVLERDGYAISTANNGREALENCTICMPDLVLMDVMMPEMDGFAACKEILKLDNKTHPVILLVTALNDEESIEKAFRSGATDFIPKPVNLMVLRKRIEHLLQTKSAEQHVQKLAYYDSLTNLPNRTLFIDKANGLIRKASRNDSLLALLFLDLDRFKMVNDTQGHHVGDLLLKTVSQRLIGCLRNTDIIARLGGDEFVILLDGPDSANTVALVAEKICKKLNQPFSFLNQQVYVSSSIGISIYNNKHLDIYALMKQADTAMYQAKSKGGGCFQFYEHGMETEIARRLEMESELRRAISDDQLELFYQPLMRLSDRQIIGAEALIRWQHPSRGLLPPIEFIPLAEDCGLIVPLGEWVVDRACRQLAEWRDKGERVTPIAVNVSSLQIEDPNLYQKIKSVIEQYQIEQGWLKIEITENSLVNIDEAIIDQLLKIKSMGVELSIDDFGTGYSSLHYLKRFPVNTLKIDRCFIKDMSEGNEDASIVSGIIALGHSLGLTIVAEGVEQKEQEQLLMDKSCDFIQGYYLSRPLPQQEFYQWLTSHHDKALM